MLKCEGISGIYLKCKSLPLDFWQKSADKSFSNKSATQSVKQLITASTKPQSVIETINDFYLLGCQWSNMGTTRGHPGAWP